MLNSWNHRNDNSKKKKKIANLHKIKKNASLQKCLDNEEKKLSAQL